MQTFYYSKSKSITLTNKNAIATKSFVRFGDSSGEQSSSNSITWFVVDAFNSPSVQASLLKSCTTTLQGVLANR